jgi:hypothetical protein
VISVNRDDVVCSFQIVSSLFETAHDDEHLLVVDFVVPFRIRKLSGEKRYGVHPSFVGLGESPADGEVEGVCFEKDEERGLEMFQNRSEGKAGFQKVESDLASSRPNEFFEVSLERF